MRRGLSFISAVSCDQQNMKLIWGGSKPPLAKAPDISSTDLPAAPPVTRPQEQHLGCIIPSSQGRSTFGDSLGTPGMVTIIKCINIYFYERTSNCQVYTHNKLFERSGGKWRLQYSGELSKQISPCRKGQVIMAQLWLSPRTCAIIYPPNFFCSCVENRSALIGHIGRHNMIHQWWCWSNIGIYLGIIATG